MKEGIKLITTFLCHLGWFITYLHRKRTIYNLLVTMPHDTFKFNGFHNQNEIKSFDRY